MNIIQQEYEWPKDWCRVGKDFLGTLHMSITEVYDPFVSFAMQKFQIDIIRFDDKLHRKFGDYEQQGMSMKDVIANNYGEQGLKLIEQLI